MKIYQMLDVDKLEQEIQEGWVRKVEHPTQPLVILNYTKHAQAAQHWNPVTRACRGLIVDESNGDVVARPFEKFFNWEELSGARRQAFDPTEMVEVTDKMDGSLGIMYTDAFGNVRMASRGSFRSTQADRANLILMQKYPDFRPIPGWTHLFEIVYPENRIVLDYGDTEDLVLLGSVDIRSGASLGPGWPVHWTGPRAEVLPYKTLTEALSVAPRPNKEGIVVRFVYTDERVKLKQADYVELHRIVTGLDDKSVWDRCQRAWLADPDPAVNHEPAILDGVPDELYEFVTTRAYEFFSEFFKLSNAVDSAWRAIDNEFQGFQYTRGQFAGEANQYPKAIRKALFLKLDGISYDELLWKFVKPKGGNNSV